MSQSRASPVGPSLLVDSVPIHCHILHQQQTTISIRKYFTLPHYRHHLHQINCRRKSKDSNRRHRKPAGHGCSPVQQPTQRRVTRKTSIELIVDYEAICEQVTICTTDAFDVDQTVQGDTADQRIASRQSLHEVASEKHLQVQLTRPQLNCLLGLLVRFDFENAGLTDNLPKLGDIANISSIGNWLCLKYRCNLERSNAMRRHHILDHNDGKRAASVKSTELRLSTSLDDHSVAQSLRSYLGNAPLARNRWAGIWAAMADTERELREALYEIVHTEKVFVTNLKQALDRFVPHCHERLNYSHHALNRRLTPSQYVRLWANLRDIYQLHRSLYRKMLFSLDRKLLSSLGHILHQFFHQPTFAGHYRAYIVNQPDQQAVLATEAVRPYRHTLDFILITPVQRVMRYKLMLENVIAAGQKCKWSVDIEVTLGNARAAHRAIKEVLEESNRQAKLLANKLTT